MAFEISKPISKASRFEALRAASIAASKEESPANSGETSLSKTIRALNPADCSERIRIVFDDSGSMGGKRLADAKTGTVEFLRNCIPGQTAVAIHLMNPRDQYQEVNPVIITSELSTDLILLASSVDSRALIAPGGTPLFPTILQALRATPRATRLIAFTDGSPDSLEEKEKSILLAIELKIPIDTVLIGGWAVDLMKEIADRTGGFFLDFSKGDSFASAFKYLAPVQRLRLMDGAFKASLEGK